MGRFDEFCVDFDVLAESLKINCRTQLHNYSNDAAYVHFNTHNSNKVVCVCEPKGCNNKRCSLIDF